MATFQRKDQQKQPRRDERLHAFDFEQGVMPGETSLTVMVRGSSRYTARMRLRRRLQALLGDPSNGKD